MRVKLPPHLFFPLHPISALVNENSATMRLIALPLLLSNAVNISTDALLHNFLGGGDVKAIPKLF